MPRPMSSAFSTDLRWNSLQLSFGRQDPAAAAARARRRAELTKLGERLDGSARRLSLSGATALGGVEAETAGRLVQELLEAAAAERGDLGAARWDQRGAADAESGRDAEAAADACAKVRRLLRLHPVARSTREFIGGLLYLALVGSAREEDTSTWTSGLDLVDFLVAELCGHASGRKNDPGELTPCPECICSHIAIQEAFSLVKYVRSYTADGAVEVSAQFQDGLLLILATLSQLINSLHPDCGASVREAQAGSAEASLAWEPLLSELEAAGCDTPVAWRSLPAVAPPAAMAFAEVAANAERSRLRPRTRAIAFPEYGFASFPPALPPSSTSAFGAPRPTSSSRHSSQR